MCISNYTNIQRTTTDATACMKEQNNVTGSLRGCPSLGKNGAICIGPLEGGVPTDVDESTRNLAELAASW